MSLFKRLIFSDVKYAFSLLNSVEKYQLIVVLLVSIFLGIVESLVVASVFPFVYLMMDPSYFKEVPYLADVLSYFTLSLDDLLPVLGGGIVAIVLFGALLNALYVYLSEKYNETSIARLSLDFYKIFSGAPYSWIVRQRNSDIEHVFRNDIRRWRQNVIRPVLMAIQSVIIILFTSVSAILISPLEGVYSIIILGLVSVIMMHFVRKPLKKGAVKARKNETNLYFVLSQYIRGVRDIKVESGSYYFTSQLKSTFLRSSRSNYLIKSMSGIPGPALSACGQISFICVAVVLWGLDYSAAEITAQIALVGVVVSRVLPAANKFNSSVTTIDQAMPFLESIRKSIDGASSSKGWIEGAGGSGLKNCSSWDSIEFKDVKFSYPNQDNIIEGINVTFRKGKFYGLVGESGAGKSTLINLFLGLFSPTSGEIQIDGLPRETFDPKSWLKRLAYVPQEVFLLAGTVRDNIEFGQVQVNSNRVLDAVLRCSALSDVVAKLPDGINTKLGEDGHGVSGGQKQRIAIARALYRCPDVLILDEGTSALDQPTEARVLNQLHRDSGDRLTIVVSHRVRALKECDEIILLKDGAISDVGTYSELQRRSELFRRLSTDTENGGQ
ncbi:ABC transporter ATP-binding protein [Methylophaga sp.]|uniref:ABC transporter ATP-binding protein n=1 Tax=Methylophaga sp. TaxID=2024840 RepID=UPI003A926282